MAYRDTIDHAKSCNFLFWDSQQMDEKNRKGDLLKQLFL